MTWRAAIVLVLDAELPEWTGARRDDLAQRILDALVDELPAMAIAGAITESARTVLTTRGFEGVSSNVLDEIGRNAGQVVLGTIRTGDVQNGQP